MPADYRVCGTTMFSRDDLERSPVGFYGDSNNEGSGTSLERVFCVSGDTVCSVVWIGKWKCRLYVRLYPKTSMVRRWMDFEWTGAEKRKFTGIWLTAGKVLCDHGNGCYLLPGEFPPFEHVRSSFVVGRKVRGDGNVAAVVADDGNGRSCLVCIGDMEHYSDRGNVTVYECKDGFAVMATFGSSGYAIPGVRQTVGDVWMRFGFGTAESELGRMHEWHRMSGYLPPTDRPPRVQDLVIYSMHPKGRSESGAADVGGFQLAKKYLPYVRELGVNCVWMRPVYHAGGYKPDKMYEIQEGIGTEADELDYVRSAHALGMEVWCDAVPHGGKTSNERTQQHPEWVCRKEDGTYQRDYWAYDFNWPTWVKYFSDWVEWYTRKYELDGWRMDVPTGSKFPNWNPDIPYARASYAQQQGGIAQQKSIRAAARRANPNAVTLGEENGAGWATVADLIYDQMLCHAHFHALREGDAASFVRDLRRWLHEQRLAYPPGTVWLRYPESHDSKLAVNLWGQACANALMALSAWIEGVPLVCQGGEIGAFEEWRRIFSIRAALPELRRGDVDYISASAPDGVFVCIRKLGGLESAVIVNFNDTRVHGTAAGVPIDLPAYGYEVRRLKGPSVDETLGQENPFAPKVKKSSCAFTDSVGLAVCEGVVVELRNQTNGLLRVKNALDSVKTSAGICVSVKAAAIQDPKSVRMVVRFADTERWFAHSAEGSFASPFFVSHPGVQGKVKCWTGCNGGRLVDPEVCWSNYSHPFGLCQRNAEVGSASADGAFCVSGFRPGTLVELRDRLGGEEGFSVSISGEKAEDLVCCVRPCPLEEAFARREPSSGDARLRFTAGGWMYDDGSIRVRFSNSGAILSAWTKANDSWRRELGYCGWYGLKTADFISALGWGAREQKVALQSYDCYGRTLLSHDATGNLVLEFSDVMPAMFGRQYLSQALSCRARYVLGKGVMTAETTSNLDRRKLRNGDVGRWEYRMSSRVDKISEAIEAVALGVKPLAKTIEEGVVRWVFMDGNQSAYGDGSWAATVKWMLQGRTNK